MIIKKMKNVFYFAFVFIITMESDKKTHFSKLYYEIYNDIANYRILTKEQLEKLSCLSSLERLNIILTYNKIITILIESDVIDKL